MRQVLGLLELGHDVHIFSERRPDELRSPAPLPSQLTDRIVYLSDDMPQASGYWSMSAWPPSGETWVPGAEHPIRNRDRLLEAVPALRRCLDAAPALTISVLDPDQYDSQATSLEALYHLSSLLKPKQQYDIVHAHFGPVGNSFRFIRQLWNVPLAVTFYGFDFSIVPRLSGPGVYRRLFAEADSVVAISEHSKGRLVELGCAADKLDIVNLAVCPTDFAFRERYLAEGEPVRILTVGRFVEKKGLEYSIRAVAEARRRFQNVQYEIIGDGPLRPSLERLIGELGLANTVNLLGAAGHDFVRQKMAESHLFILASVTAGDGDQEGTPVALMEAQACGLPVLSTYHSGIPEIVAHGESGFLAPERNDRDLADRLVQLLEHPEWWPKMGIAGRKIIESRYDSRQQCSRLLEVYERARGKFVSTEIVE